MNTNDIAGEVVRYVDSNGVLPISAHRFSLDILICTFERLNQRALSAQAMIFAAEELGVLVAVLDYEEEYAMFDSASALILGLIEHLGGEATFDR